jgi:hypothetical protein
MLLDHFYFLTFWAGFNIAHEYLNSTNPSKQEKSNRALFLFDRGRGLGVALCNKVILLSRNKQRRILRGTMNLKMRLLTLKKALFDL